MLFPDGVFQMNEGEWFWLVDGRLRGPRRTKEKADEEYATDVETWKKYYETLRLENAS